MRSHVDSSPGRNVFLDRDGVINVNRDDHVKSWDEFRFLPGALEGLRLLTEYGYRIFVVTNQAAVNRGLITHATLQAIHQRMVATAKTCGAHIVDVSYCPHRPDEDCDCRKPRPGMLLSLAATYQIDLHQAFMIGDALSDIAAGQAAGCRTILVLSGRGQAQLAQLDTSQHRPNYVARDLFDAALLLCNLASLESAESTIMKNVRHKDLRARV